MAKNKMDSNNPDTYVISRLNGKKYLRIGYNHVSKYGYTISEYMEKFNLSKDDIISKVVSKSLAFTKEVAIDRYGEEEGLKKWNEYRSKQAKSNTFEYKHNKFGMTKDVFKKYNLSRSVTLKNLIKRHGEIDGKVKWDEYCNRQAYAGCSINYFIEKHGEIDGKLIYDDICKRKAITLSNMIRVHGKEEGTKRYNSWVEIQRPAISTISLELLDKVKEFFPKNKIYYGYNGTGEYKLYDNCSKKLYLYDYVDLTKKKCIEFHGDYFHGNPILFNENDTPNFYDRTITCKQMWENDRQKQEVLKRLRDIDTLEIWEKEFRDNREQTIKKCIDFINYDGD